MYNHLKKSRCLEEIAIVLRLNGKVFYAVLGDHLFLGLTSHGKHVKRVNSHLRCAKYVAEIVFVRPGLKSNELAEAILERMEKDGIEHIEATAAIKTMFGLPVEQWWPAKLRVLRQLAMDSEYSTCFGPVASLDGCTRWMTKCFLNVSTD